ncbi:hypothetical protein KR222_007647 [Zaprionus bogoriensis]|nr:hypothetical protein KR222_007647 [Zaprionus bogoriensis]
MKLFLIAFAVIAAVAADVSHLPSNEYLPPVQPQEEIQTIALPSNEYLAPQEVAVEQGTLAADGYRYKTQRRVVLRRHRRDVSHLSSEYLPPVQSAAPSNEYLPPVQASAPIQVAAPAPIEIAAPIEEAVPAHELADDGYRYKTHRRVVLRRHRRDVSHLPSNEYLPPGQESVVPSNQYLAPVANVVEEIAPVEQGVLADDGYRYKTQRRVVLRRHRRDVSHLPANEYLPPVQAAAPSNEYLPPVQASAPIQVAAPAPIEIAAPIEEPVPAHELADDGYRYKTHRRVVLRRHRRDVSHLPSNEYLPPVQPQEEIQTIALPSNEYLAPAVEQGSLADDGYRYKTQRRVVLRRHRRDVSHLSSEYLPPVQSAAPSNEYLPPVQASAPIQVAAPAPIEIAAPIEEPVPAHELADDGYRYKTHRRVVLRRHRRDVSHLPANEYLPPAPVAAAPVNEYLPPVQAPAPIQIAAPAPIQVAAPVEVSAPVEYSVPAVEAAPAHELAADGYRYKTQRRVVYRRH